MKTFKEFKESVDIDGFYKQLKKQKNFSRPEVVKLLGNHSSGEQRLTDSHIKHMIKHAEPNALQEFGVHHLLGHVDLSKDNLKFLQKRTGK